MDTTAQSLRDIRALLDEAVAQVSRLGDASGEAFTQATRTLEGTATQYQRTVHKHERRASDSIDEAHGSLATAIRLVDELMSQETAQQS